MSSQIWAKGAWSVAAIIMATGVAWAALPQTQNDPTGGISSGGTTQSTQGTAGVPAGAAQVPAGTAQYPANGQQSADWNQNRGRGMGARADVDHYLVKVLKQANQDEVATARLAEQRSSNQDVKKFAMQIVADHTRFLARLEQSQAGRGNRAGRGIRALNRGTFNTPGATTGTSAVPSGQVQGASQAGSDTANDHNATSPVQGNQPAAGGTFSQPATAEQGVNRMPGQDRMANRRSAPHDFVQIMDQVAEMTQKSVQRELSQKEGAQFDRCFLSWQVMDHIWLTDALTVFEQHASPSLRPILQEGMQTAQQHLATAKSLLARIEGQAKSTAEREPGSLQSR